MILRAVVSPSGSGTLTNLTRSSTTEALLNWPMMIPRPIARRIQSAKSWSSSLSLDEEGDDELHDLRAISEEQLHSPF